MRRVLNAQGVTSTPSIPSNMMVSLQTKFGGPKCKGMKTRAKSSKKLMRRVLNAQGTKFESPNQKGMETRSKRTKIVNAQGTI